MTPEELLRQNAAVTQQEYDAYEAQLNEFNAQNVQAQEAIDEREQEQTEQREADAKAIEESQKNTIDQIQEANLDLGDVPAAPDNELVNTGVEIANAITNPTYTFIQRPFMDLAMDGIGRIPGLGFLDDSYDEATKTRNPILADIRGALSAIVPEYSAGMATGGLAAKMSAPLIVRGLSALGMDAGVSVFVASISDESEKDGKNFSNIINENSGGLINLPNAIEDGDTPEIRREKNKYDALGTSIVGSIIGAGAYKFGNKAIRGSNKLYKSLLSWFEPKDGAARRAASIAKDTLIDEPTAKAVAELDELINGGLVSKKQRGEYIAQRDKLINEAREQGFSSATPEPMESYVAREADSRQIQIDEDAIRMIEAGPAVYKGTYIPEMQSNLAPEAAVPRQSIPPLNVARNRADTAAIKSGAVLSGDPTPIITTPMLNKGIRAEGDTRDVIVEVAAQQTEAGNYSATINDVRFSQKGMSEAVLKMMNEILQANDEDGIKELFAVRNIYNLPNGGQIFTLPDVEMNAAAASIKPLAEELIKYMSPEVNQSSAQVINTLGQEIATISKATIDNPGLGDNFAIKKSILNKLEFLLNEYGISKYITGYALQQRKWWKNAQQIFQGDAAKVKKAVSEIKAEEVDEFLIDINKRKAEIKENVRTFIQSLDNADDKDIIPLIDAFARTDGDVTNIEKLVAYAAQQIDPRTLIWSPKGGASLFANTVAKFFYGNILSAKSLTGAMLGATAGITQKAALRQFGPLMQKDPNFTDIRAVFMANRAFAETNARAIKYAWSIFKRAQADPSDVLSIARRDNMVGQEYDWSIVDRAAKNWTVKENAGQLFNYNLTKGIDWLSSLKISTAINSGLTATDAFMASTLATMESRYKAYMNVTNGGLLPLDKKAFQKAEKEMYDSYFDGRGLMTNKMVQLSSGELALNLDNGVATAISKAVERAPILRTLFPFPRTSINDKYLATSYVPWFSRLPIGGKYHAVMNAGNDIDKIKEAMALHGVTEDVALGEDIVNLYYRVRGEYRARVAFGGALAAAAYQLAMNGMITASGSADAQRRKQLAAEGYPFYSVTIPGIGPVNYENWGQPWPTLFGIMGTWAENTQILGPNYGENLLGLIGFTLAMNFTSRLGLENLQPLVDWATGDNLESAGGRMLSQFIRGNVPQSGNLGVVENAINDSLIDIQGQLLDQIARKTASRLPGASDRLGYTPNMMTGQAIRQVSHPVLRILNSINPAQITEAQEWWEEDLNEIGWSMQSRFLKDENGFELPDTMRMQLQQYIGDQQAWREIVKTLKKTRSQNILNDIRYMREQGYSAEEINLKVTPLFDELNIIKQKAYDKGYKKFYASNPDYVRLLNVNNRIKAANEQGRARDIDTSLLDERRRLMNVLNIKNK